MAMNKDTCRPPDGSCYAGNGVVACPEHGVYPQLVGNGRGLYHYRCPRVGCQLHDGPMCLRGYIPYNWQADLQACAQDWNRSAELVRMGYEVAP